MKKTWKARLFSYGTRHTDGVPDGFRMSVLLTGPDAHLGRMVQFDLNDAMVRTLRDRLTQHLGEDGL